MDRPKTPARATDRRRRRVPPSAVCHRRIDHHLALSRKSDASARREISLQALFSRPQCLLRRQAAGSKTVEPSLWLVGPKTPDIPPKPLGQRLAKFLAPSAPYFFEYKRWESAVSQFMHTEGQRLGTIRYDTMRYTLGLRALHTFHRFTCTHVHRRADLCKTQNHKITAIVL